MCADCKQLQLRIDVLKQHLGDAHDRVRQLTDALRKLAQSDHKDVAAFAQQTLDTEFPYDGNVARW